MEDKKKNRFFAKFALKLFMENEEIIDFDITEYAIKIIDDNIVISGSGSDGNKFNKEYCKNNLKMMAEVQFLKAQKGE